MAPRVWLVTGCSQGFGELFVSSIVARGDKVVATARNVEHLEAEGRVSVMQLDVTDSEANLTQKADQAHCDVLVNNAGYVLSGVWEELR